MTGDTPFNLLVLGTSGLDLLETPLRQAMRAGGFDPVAVHVAGYNQWRQRLLAPESNSASDHPDVVFIVLDGEDLLSPLLDDIPGHVEAAAEQVCGEMLTDVIDVLRQGVDNHSAAQFLVTTVLRPTGDMLGSLGISSHRAWSEAVDSFNRGLGAWADKSRRVHLIDMQELAIRHGLRTMRDERLWALARCRWSRTGLSLIARRTASLVEAIHGRQRKCLVLDLDNTLWGGLAGEEGIAHIDLGHEGIGLAYREFQLRLKRLRNMGVLLAIASKNDEQTAWNVIDNHPDMVLRRDDFAAARINWSDKADNLREIADELNIDPAALVFIDDDPAQRDRVRNALPQVAVPDWPDEITDLPIFAEGLAWDYFNRVRLIEDDLRKTEQYHARTQRDSLRDNSPSIEQWLRSLRMTSRVILPDPAVLPRFAQLTQKTNQFNVTTRRYTEVQLAQLADDPDWIILGADLADRFGQSGIVGLAIAKCDDTGHCTIDTFLLSCRIIGRTLERSLLHALAETARHHGATTLHAEYRPSNKNTIVKNLWHDLGFTRTPDAPSRNECSRWHLDLTPGPPQPSEYIELTFPPRTPIPVSKHTPVHSSP